MTVIFVVIVVVDVDVTGRNGAYVTSQGMPVSLRNVPFDAALRSATF